ncbi:hypothetical protein DW866_06035 [Bacteroides eggerthii]|jgi:hypothetical protein|nr:hypothetical protein DW866_06035 [Bacteroides eggerthii]
MTELKKWITTALLTLLLLPAMAQQKADTTYTFRFVPQKDMFYVPWNGNDMELARLLECIESNKADILDGKLPLYVDGYCNSLNGEKENLAIAKIRSNRVKSELITRAGIKEESFITRNHPAEGDFVTVRLTVPAEETTVSDVEAEAQRKAEAERLATEKRAEQERLAEEQRKAEEARLAAEKAEAEKAAQQNTLADTPSETKITNDYHLSLRANLLRWATLTPDLGTLTACYHAKGTVKGSDGATGGVAGRNYKGLMPYGGIITACYWGGNGQEQGIGEDQVGTGGTTMVTDSNWSGAKDAMNDALQSAGSEWQYELTGALPTLKKQ